VIKTYPGLDKRFFISYICSQEKNEINELWMKE